MSDFNDAPIDDQSPSTISPSDEAFDIPARWPTVVGWLSTIFGSISLVCGGAGIAMAVFLMPYFMSMGTKPGGTPPPAMTFSMLVLSLMFLGLLWQIVLVIAGVSTIMRKSIGRPLHLMYVIGFLLTSIPSTLLGWQQQQVYMNSPELAQWKAENPGNPMAAGLKSNQSPLMMIPGVAINLAWPTFCLIWFMPAGRSERGLRRDDEDVLV